MSQNSSNSKSNQPSSVDSSITNKSLESILELQKLRVQNEAASLAFKEKELSANVELAKQSMNLEAELQKNRPRETRKSFLYIATFVVLVLFIFLGFLGVCLYLGKEQFVIDLLKYALYPASAGGGYWIGRKSTKKSYKKESPSIPDAQIID